MTEIIVYPDMRLNVEAALSALSDLEYQQTRWGKPEGNFFDDLTLDINILYDDAMVLPDPRGAVPEILHGGEVAAFAELGSVLSSLISDLGNAPDDSYTQDQRWPAVVEAAGIALAVMRKHDNQQS